MCIHYAGYFQPDDDWSIQSKYQQVFQTYRSWYQRTLFSTAYYAIAIHNYATGSMEWSIFLVLQIFHLNASILQTQEAGKKSTFSSVSTSVYSSVPTPHLHTYVLQTRKAGKKTYLAVYLCSLCSTCLAGNAQVLDRCGASSPSLAVQSRPESEEQTEKVDSGRHCTAVSITHHFGAEGLCDCNVHSLYYLSWHWVSSLQPCSMWCMHSAPLIPVTLFLL